jgi:acetoin utilization deacetylase AcuC-like enzyme
VVVVDEATYTEVDGGAGMAKENTGYVGDAGVVLSSDAVRPWLPPAPVKDVPATCYVHGMPLRMGLWYDVTHVNHAPPPDTAAPRDLPHAVTAAHAGISMARAMTENVLALAPVEAPTGLGPDAEAALQTADGILGFNELAAASEGPKRGMYATTASLGVARRVHGMVQDAVSVVLDGRDGVHTGMVVCRPVGAALPPATSGHGAFGNAVWTGVQAARAKGHRVAVVSLQGDPPMGLVQAAADDEGVAVVSVHYADPKDEESTASFVMHGGRAVGLGFPYASASHTDMHHAMRCVVGPAVAAFEPDCIMVVLGDDTDPTLPLACVQQNIGPKTVIDLVQRMVSIQSRVVVVLDVMQRLTRAAEIAGAAAHALQGRGCATNKIRPTVRAALQGVVKGVTDQAAELLPPDSALVRLFEKYSISGVQYVQDARLRELKERSHVAAAQRAASAAKTAAGV